MRRYELTEEQFELIADLLPRQRQAVAVSGTTTG